MHRVGTALLLVTLVMSTPAMSAQSPEERALNELRNTVVNLLQGLVEQGVLPREKAEQMVRDAQAKAASDAAGILAREKEEEGAVRVPFVPQIVREELRKQVTADLEDKVAQNVIEQAKTESWGVPGALPEWIKRMRWSGDARLRAQADMFASDNTANNYLNFQTVNQAGGIGKAGTAALLNTTEDRQRLRARIRLGFDANLGYGWSMAGRLATGDLKDPVSTNQTLGTTGSRYQVGLDLAYIEWNGNSDTGRHVFTASGGRIRSPWLSSNLVWDEDVTFEGIAANYRLGLMRDDPYAHYAFVTLGAFPVQEVELASDKWLFGGQMGLDWKYSGGSRLRLGAAYYSYQNITGRRNAFGSNLLDYTAPQFLQRGNTLFDIRNDADTSTNLFALAAEYKLADVMVNFDWRVSPGYRLSLSGDFVKNVGFDRAGIQHTTGLNVEPRTNGYQAELGFGSASMASQGAWRAYFGYRYLQRDAVLDAFTDSDFRLGGTDVKGYFLGAEYGLTPRVNARVRYLSGSEIDGPPLGIDVLQLDLNASF
jgi:hypothetical protein